VRFGCVAVIGVGLIGGSCALAWKRAGVVDRVIGVGRSRPNLDRAIELGVIDSIAPSVADAVREADAVLITTPVGQFEALLREVGPALKADAFITDGGSTKQDVVAAARSALGDRFPRFVPAHPIAGAERSGVEAARVDLFVDRNIVITPLAETAPDAVDRATALWLATGARLSRLSPGEHDEVFAAVSHLPHALAFALVDMIASCPDGERLFGYAAGGFRDFTRIASSSPEMWRDICVANRDALLRRIDDYQSALTGLRSLVDAGDAAGLEALFTRARDARDAWLRSREDR